MRILLTNDDGIHAPGLAALEEIARGLSDDIWVCAPAEEQSGAGHSLTLHHPVRLRELSAKRYAVTGTPTDCVMLAVNQLMETKPDLILSGVNRGQNLGDDITYSGTVSAAMEGALAGIRSVALSQAYGRAEVGKELSYDGARGWGEKVLRPLLDMDFGERTLININFPALPAAEVEGIRICRQGFHDYARVIVDKNTDPRGMDYYWFGLRGIAHTPSHKSDLEAVKEGYISVTPLRLDLTQDTMLDKLAALY